MKEKKNYVKDWLNSGTTKEVFVKRIFITVMTIYIIYQLGYGIGTFLAHIGL